MTGPRIPLTERFWAKVQKTETCWLWTAHMNNKGYGHLAVYRADKGRHWPTYAHRIAWTLTHGTIPDGMNVLHRCDTPRCVNPAHLFLGTQADNMRDCANKGRMTPHASKSKLTPDQVRAIRLDPRKHHIIAADYGLRERTSVWLIKHRRTFSWID